MRTYATLSMMPYFTPRVRAERIWRLALLNVGAVLCALLDIIRKYNSSPVSVI